MINNVVLVGRITKDPELRTISSGSTTVSFTVAIDRPFVSNQNGQQGERQADFINCVAWNQQATFLANYVKKGYMIGVEGRISTRQYQDNQGQTRYVTEVVANRVQNLQPRGTATNSNGYANNQPSQSVQSAPVDKSYNENITDDDLPF